MKRMRPKKVFAFVIIMGITLISFRMVCQKADKADRQVETSLKEDVPQHLAVEQNRNMAVQQLAFARRSIRRISSHVLAGGLVAAYVLIFHRGRPPAAVSEQPNTNYDLDGNQSAQIRPNNALVSDSSAMIRVLLVDDHPSVMEGTRVLLEQEGNIQVFVAPNADNALEMAIQQSFDVMLIDWQMPDINGIDLSKKILNIKPDSTILIYSDYEMISDINLMIEAGAAGFVLKTANQEQLVTAIRCALRGEAILPFHLLKQLRRLSDPVKNENGNANTDTNEATLAFTDRELQIIKEIAKGKSNKEIALTMIMSQRSLEYILTNMFQKLKVKSRIEAVVKAKQLQLLDDKDLSPND